MNVAEMLASIFEDALLPFAICVGLPVSIVWLFFRSRMNETNRRSELIKLAIENNSQIDITKLVEQLNPKPRNLKQKMVSSLLTGCILIGLGLSLIGYDLWMIYRVDNGYIGGDYILYGSACAFMGIALIIAFVIGKKMMKRELEIETEEAEMKAKAKLEA